MTHVYISKLVKWNKRTQFQKGWLFVKVTRISFCNAFEMMEMKKGVRLIKKKTATNKKNV